MGDIPLSFDFFKIPTFSGINDTPREPTAELAGNGSHVIARYNSLIDKLIEFEESYDWRFSFLANKLKTLLYNTVWYVDSINGDDSNDGLDVSRPLKTLKTACEIAVSHSNPNSYARRIALGNGNFEGCELPGFIPTNNQDIIYIQSVADNPENTTIVGDTALAHCSPGLYRLRSVRIKPSSTSGTCLFINNAHLQLENVIFGQINQQSHIHIEAHNHSLVEVVSNYKIEGSIYKHHIFLDSLSFMDLSYNTSDANQRAVDVSDYEGCQSSFVKLNRGSYLSCWNTSFPGINEQITGKKFLLSGNSVIDTAGKDINFFPGNEQGEFVQNSEYF